MNERILCLDVGEKRIGVAVSDLMGWTAQGVETIFTKGPERDRARVVEIAKAYETNRLLVGLPYSMDGSIGYQAERVMAFVRGFEGSGLVIRYQDERLTSASATRTLLEGNVRRDKRKLVIDKLAATYILQSFMDAGGWREEQVEEVKAMDDERFMESGNPIVELIDEDGKLVRFEHIYTVPYEQDEYVLLLPVDEVEGVGEDEVIIMRIEPGDEEDAYVGIDDDELLEKVFEKYLELAEEDDDEPFGEEYDDEDDEDEDAGEDKDE